MQCLGKVPHKEYVVSYPNHVNFTVDVPLDKNSSMYDDFSFIHMDLNPLIHFTGQFLPWHRSFVHRFERALREECGFIGTQPYWDWTKDADDFYNSPIFDPDPRTGLGGWGDPSADFQITTGAFASDFVRRYPVPHPVRRNYTVISSIGGLGDGAPPITQPLNTFFTPERINAMVDGFPGDFLGFQALFEGGDGSHGAIHQIVGGDLVGMCPLAAGPNCKRGPKWTPNDPLFYLHHAMVDKLWYDWQRRHPENFWSFHGGSIGAHSAPGIYAQFPNGGPPFLNFDTDVPGDGLLNNATIFEVMDTRAYDFCYTYE
ncbi:Di-copper centre-containing protein [Thelephora ganbajun]|uniref:Di-copper centre-containing protein n=1 Tax=Thelephora ganbajun TaxID=370292 RepID=A0ACB6Z8T5_THEGA|nr:Di-copper centre-containing protein [Thelephora ganbajun]